MKRSELQEALSRRLSPVRVEYHLDHYCVDAAFLDRGGLNATAAMEMLGKSGDIRLDYGFSGDTLVLREPLADEDGHFCGMCGAKVEVVK